jgi:hypothetical protein
MLTTQEEIVVVQKKTFNGVLESESLKKIRGCGVTQTVK